MPNSLAIIGAGRVGRALGRRLRELGWRIDAVVTAASQARGGLSGSLELGKLAPE